MSATKRQLAGSEMIVGLMTDLWNSLRDGLKLASVSDRILFVRFTNKCP